MNIETDKQTAQGKLFDKFGIGYIRKIKFGKIRRDGTRGVSFEFQKNASWHKGSYIYLTDIPR